MILWRICFGAVWRGLGFTPRDVLGGDHEVDRAWQAVLPRATGVKCFRAFRGDGR